MTRLAGILTFGLTALAGCASDPTTDLLDGPGQIPHPTQGTGKADATAARTFVQATITGAESGAVDSRLTPYVPVVSLDNVLIYGCDTWKFSTDNVGLEIELTELVHSSFVVDPSDPTRAGNRLEVFIPRHYTGAGDYTAEASYSPSSVAAAAGRFYSTRDACAVHVASDGGITGTFDCTLASQAGASVAITGTFACPGTDRDSPNFARWTPPTR